MEHTMHKQRYQSGHRTGRCHLNVEHLEDRQMLSASPLVLVRLDPPEPDSPVVLHADHSGSSIRLHPGVIKHTFWEDGTTQLPLVENGGSNLNLLGQLGKGNTKTPGNENSDPTAIAEAVGNLAHVAFAAPLDVEVGIGADTGLELNTRLSLSGTTALSKQLQDILSTVLDSKQLSITVLASANMSVPRIQGNFPQGQNNQQGGPLGHAVPQDEVSLTQAVISGSQGTDSRSETPVISEHAQEVSTTDSPTLSRTFSESSVQDEQAASVSDQFSPEPSGVLTEAAPFDFGDMESAVQRFLDQLVDLPQNLGHWFGSWAALPWVLMSVAGLATIHEICRRKQQKANRNAM